MKDIKSNSFNETMSSLLIQLRNAVDNLSPEHIQMLPVNLVDKARSFTENEFIFDDNAMVNSVDGYKLNSMIRWLTSNNMEYLVGGVELHRGSVIPESDGWGFTIMIPEGWDGRNGFAFFLNEKASIDFARSNDDYDKIISHITITMTRDKIVLSGFYQVDVNYEEFDIQSIRYILWRNKDV